MPLKKLNRGFSFLLFLLFIASVLIAGYYIQEKKLTLGDFRGLVNYECNVPILITLGDIDPRFKLSNDTILKALDTSSQVWEKAVNKDLFVFDGKNKSKVIVNFVYDSRQQEAVLSSAAKKELESGWATYEKLVSDRKAIDIQYQNLKTSYESDLANYNQEVKNYQTNVNSWNKKPGTKEEYLALKTEETRLASQYSALEKKRISVNSLADKVNTYNSQISDLYQKLSLQTQKYNKQFASDNQITVGEYDGTYYINIYQYISLDQLRITLAHELGHALGMNHVENENSIMYPLQGKQNGENLTLTKEDLLELNRVCK